MKVRALLIFGLLLSWAAAYAATTTMSGTIVSMTSVECGSKKKGKKESTALLCQQYLVHTATSEYKIQQQKPGDQEIIPANTPIQFTIDKNKMKFKVNNKKYEYIIVSTAALNAQAN
ncbi:MAG TPA: hypothetical protein VMT75_07100 [Candidatus Saccharimonadales bacterium]|nr:hypothetical protein [Candidatus Saccharimonadales bacterium]